MIMGPPYNYRPNEEALSDHINPWSTRPNVMIIHVVGGLVTLTFELSRSSSNVKSGHVEIQPRFITLRIVCPFVMKGG